MGVEAIFQGGGGQYGYLSGVANVMLKTFYNDGMNDQIHNGTIANSRLSTRVRNWTGKDNTMALRIGRNEAVIVVGNRGKLPAPDREKHDVSVWGTRYAYSRGLIDGQAIEAAKNDVGSFINLLDDAMNRISENLAYDENRMWFMDGRGHLAQAGTVAGTTVPLVNPGGFSNPRSGTQYIREGMRLAAINGGTTVQTIVTVTSVDPANSSMEVTPAPTWTAGNPIVKVSDAGVTSLVDTGYHNEPFGMRALVGNGNPAASYFVGNIDASLAAKRFWRSGVVQFGGTPVTLQIDYINKALDYIPQISSNTMQRVSACYTTYGLIRQLANLMYQKQIFIGNVKFDSGYQTITHNGIPLFPDNACPVGHMFWLQESDFVQLRQTDYKWISEGGILFRLEDYDAFQFAMKKYYENAVLARNRSVVIKDLIDT